MKLPELSARFIMAVMFSGTYCLIMLGCTWVLIKNHMAVETYIAVLATFALVVREIADAYFKREDRKPKEEVTK